MRPGWRKTPHPFLNHIEGLLIHQTIHIQGSSPQWYLDDLLVFIEELHGDLDEARPNELPVVFAVKDPLSLNQLKGLVNGDELPSPFAQDYPLEVWILQHQLSQSLVEGPVLDDYHLADWLTSIELQEGLNGLIQQVVAVAAGEHDSHVPAGDAADWSTGSSNPVVQLWLGESEQDKGRCGQKEHGNQHGDYLRPTCWTLVSYLPLASTTSGKQALRYFHPLSQNEIITID